MGLLNALSPFLTTRFLAEINFRFGFLFFAIAHVKVRIDSFSFHAIAFEKLRICFSFQSQG